jgi:hypothetical protein
VSEEKPKRYARNKKKLLFISSKDDHLRPFKRGYFSGLMSDIKGVCRGLYIRYLWVTYKGFISYFLGVFLSLNRGYFIGYVLSPE